LELFLPNDSNIGWITAVGEKATGQRSIKTRVVDLAPYLAAFRPDLVKIDVEGFELFVLRPFLSVLSDDYQPSFLVELGWGVSNPHWDGFMRFSREVAARGYLFVEALTGRELSLTELSTLKQTVDVVIRPRLERSERFRTLSEGRVGASLFNPQ
jgi:hypothetical protein